MADTRVTVWISLIVSLSKCERADTDSENTSHRQTFDSSHMVERLHRLSVLSGLRHKPSARSATGSILGATAEVWSSRASSPF
jgi:hypothetical protein